MIATAVAVLSPMAAALLLSGTQALADADSSPFKTEIAATTHTPTSLDTLGRANAVAWISHGHLSGR